MRAAKQQKSRREAECEHCEAECEHRDATTHTYLPVLQSALAAYSVTLEDIDPSRQYNGPQPI